MDGASAGCGNVARMDTDTTSEFVTMPTGSMEWIAASMLGEVSTPVLDRVRPADTGMVAVNVDEFRRAATDPGYLPLSTSEALLVEAAWSIYMCKADSGFGWLASRVGRQGRQVLIAALQAFDA